MLAAQLSPDMTQLPSAAGRLSFDACYRAHRNDVYRWAMRYSGGQSAWAEDLTLDVFMRLLSHLPHLKAQHELSPWLYRATANLALNRHRDEKSLVGRLARWVSGQKQTVPSPSLALARRETVLATLRELPPGERVVLSMKVLDGKSQKEIAEALSMSEGWVSKLTARALETVRKSGWEMDEVSHGA